MKLGSYLTAITLTALLSACASTENAQNAASDSETQTARNEIVCEQVTAVGTHMKKRSCKTREQMKAEEEASQQLIRERRTIINVDRGN